MALVRVPPASSLQDGQFIQVQGPDGITTGYHYDKQQKALYFKESQVLFPSFHGATHIAEDPVPNASCDTPGLMSSDDKCKLDAMLQTRVGVLGFQGAGFCVLPNCRIMMADGSCKPIKDIVVGDVIVGGSGNPRVVEKTFSRPINENIFSLSCRSHVPNRLQLTRGHKVLAVKRIEMKCVHPDCKNRKGLPCRHNSRRCSNCEFEGIARTTPQWIPVEQLEVGDFVANRKSPIVVNDCSTIRVSDYIQCKVRDQVAWPAGYYQKTTNTSMGVEYESPQLHINATGCSLPEELPITNDLLRLFGYYLAEGSATKKRFSFALHRDELNQPIGEDICEICDKLFGIEPTIIYDREDKGRDSDGMQLVFHHSLVARFLKELLGKCSHTKRVPRFLIELPPHRQKQMLIGFMRGDGSSRLTYKSKNLEMQLCNNELVEQIGVLLDRCGCRPSYQTPKTKIDPWDGISLRNNYSVSVQASEAQWLWKAMGREPVKKHRNFTLHVDQGEYQFDEIKDIKIETHQGNVYDLTIPDEHSYVVNGIVVHNSDDGGWLQGDIILAAGTEFISLERIGNVVRFTVDSPIPLNCACFRAGARVLMADGTTKAIEDIKVGDEVITHEGQIKPVVNLMRNHHKGKIANWKVDKHSGEAFSITNNHPVMALKRKMAFFASGKVRPAVLDAPDWTNAGELKAGDLVVRRRSHDIIEDRDTVDILEELGEGYCERNGFVYPCTVGGSRNGQIDGMAHGIPRYIPVNNDLLDLIGYYAAEGSADVKNGLRFTIHTKELVFGEIGHEICRKLASLFLLEPSINNKHTENGKDIQVCSKVLSMLFRKWCGIGKSKRLPDWVMVLPNEKQFRIISALIRGDGYITHTHSTNYIKLELSARHLIDQALFIAERCGWEPTNQPSKLNRNRLKYRMSITTSKAPDLCEFLGVGYQPSQLSRERIIENHVMHRITEWSDEYYEGTVYNFEVIDDNSYIVDGVVVHNCEECQTIFFVQDETDTLSIRPPTCGGKLPGINSYGEMKVYLFPESTIADPNATGATLQNKGDYPAFIFKRYDDSIIPGAAEHEMVLKRDDNNSIQTEIGWAFTPGATGVPEMVWFMGKDDEGNQIRFDLEPSSEPGLLGSLLYKGHLITKKMGVVVDYTSTILSTNQYTIREWNVDTKEALGDPFTATNTWMFNNPENSSTGNNPKQIVMDSTIDLLPIGTLVNLWAFKVGEISGEPILRYYFREKPRFNPNHAWTWVANAQFGDVAVAREEVLPGPGSEDKDAAAQVSAIRTLERTMWGITGFDDPLFSYDIATTAGTESSEVNIQHRAVIDTSLPGLKVVASDVALDDFSERPVWLWSRRGVCNALIRADLGRPDDSEFTPFDLALRADIDEHASRYCKIIGKGEVNGLNYVRVCGLHFHDLPLFGALRVLSPETNQNLIFNYTRKFAFPSTVNEGTLGTEPTGGYPSIDAGEYCDSIVLTGDATSNPVYPGDVGDICELLHQEYSSPVIRAEFSYNSSTGLVELQFKVGVLDMSLPYEEDIGDDIDDYVRGLAPGYAVSAIYSQAGTFTGVGTQPSASPEGFIVYDGGAVIGGTQDEFWNRLEVMVRDDQVWIWWNQLLIPPSATLSSSLPTPIEVNTPYFPITQDLDKQFGKFGLRMFPGTKVRRMDLRTQITLFNEFIYGQLEVS